MASVRIHTYDDRNLDGIMFLCYDEEHEDVAGISEGISGDADDHKNVAKWVAEFKCGLKHPLSSISRLVDTANDNRVVWEHTITEMKKGARA